MKLDLNVGRYKVQYDGERGLRIANAEYSLSEATPGSELYDILTGGGDGSAGKVVNERTAMRSSAVYACVSLLAGLAASTPWDTFERIGEDRKKIKHDYWWLFNEQPNELVSAAVFWEWMLSSYLLSGDAFALIGRNRNGEAKSILPLDPRTVDVTKYGKGLKYKISPVGAEPITAVQEDVLHFPCVGFDGTRGMSPIRAAGRMAIGISLAADEYSSQFFTNSARPDFVLKTPGVPDEKAINLIRQTWMERYSSAAGNAHLPAILAGGLEPHQLTLSAEDAQLLATRQWQVIEVSRIFGVPPVLIGESEKTSSWGTGVAQMGINLGKFTMQRHLVKIQAELNRKLFYTKQYFFEFNLAGLERGDLQSRYEAYGKAMGGSSGPGFITPNEIRKKENLPPVEGGDQLTVWERKGDEKQAAATTA